MPIRYNDSAAVRSIISAHYNDGSAVRTLKQAWYNDGSAVRLVFLAGVVIPLPGGAVNDTTPTPTNALAELLFSVDGYIVGTGNTGFFVQNWFSPATVGAGDSFWIRATLNSGTTPGGASPALGVWHALSSARNWTLSQTVVGVKQCSLAIAIATDASGSNIVTTGTYTLHAEEEV